MADNKGRRRNSGSDDFDWEAYDAQSGSRSSRSTSRSSSDIARRRETDSYALHPRRTRKKSGKKQLTEKQLKRRKIVWRSVLVVCLIGIIVLTGVTIGMYFAVSREIKDMNIKNLALNYSSFIYYNDASGETRELEQIQSTTNRIWVDSEQIPQVMKDAIVSIEDERFYSHHGFDIKRTAGATVKWVLAKVGIGSSDYGGSTITQQVIKNITSEKENKASRKVKEIMRAVALENELTKDEILTMYLNIVFFAQNCWGVEAAANTYFNKSAIELTLPEAASIAGITQYPSAYDPVVHPDKNVEKRNIVLKKMLELGKITQDEYNGAVATELVTSSAYSDRRANVTSYFSDQVVSDVIRDLQLEKGYSADFATQQVYSGGLKIYATIDVNIQDIMERVYSDRENLYLYPDYDLGEDQAYYKAQSAMVIIDPYTGAVKGLVGGLGEKTDIRGWNRATQAKRQPGSAFKPLSVYAPALDLGKITEMDVVVDEEIEIGNDKWKPKNSYEGFDGEMTIKEAVARSANIPAVKVLDKIGLSSSFGYLQNKFHIPLVDKDKNFSSLALGGLSEGVSPMDMAGAYCTFVNSGRYIEPYTYTQVVDASGQVILENRPDASQAISASAAYITSDLLYGVVNGDRGTGRSAQLDCGMPAYGKTGTTDDDFDKWFVGYTPYYVGAVWFGFDQPSSLTRAGISRNPSVTAWKIVMDKIHDGLPEKQLEKPANLIEEEVCAISGKLPKSSCETTTAYFVSGTQPKSRCTSHYGNASSNYKNSSEYSGGQKGTPSPAPKESGSGYVPGRSTQAPSSSSVSSGSSGTSSSSGGNTGTSGGGSYSSGGGGYSSGGSSSSGMSSSSGGSSVSSGSSGTSSSSGGNTGTSGGGSNSSGGGAESGGESGEGGSTSESGTSDEIPTESMEE
ncbi:MAG: PBP1A family penicillin-binding protein [Clostridia bacterium]|nr:PBP1A family penicillin-binding protein [Clostridia bacterium]